MARPTPAETISGVRRILKEVVEPHVSSGYALNRLREVRAVLATVDWDNPAASVLREIEALRRVLAEVDAWAAGDPDREAAFSSRPAAAPFPLSADRTFAAVCAYRDDLARLVIDTYGRLRGWSRTHPGDGTDALQARMLEVMCA
jgi:hypothetical protein